MAIRIHVFINSIVLTILVTSLTQVACVDVQDRAPALKSASLPFFAPGSPYPSGSDFLSFFLSRAVLPDNKQGVVATSTPAPTTTTTTTTTTSVVKNDNRILNDEGTVNRDRASLMYYPTKTPVVNQDRVLSVVDSFLSKLVRPPLYQVIGNQYKPVQTTTPAKASQQSDRTFVYIEKGVLRIDTGLKTTTPIPENTTRPEKEIPDLYDKPFIGVPEGFFNDDVKQVESKVNRTRRAAGSDKVVSCLAPYQFEPCQYYKRCFQKTHESCESKTGFRGDEASRLCDTAQEVTKSAASDILKTYLKDVEDCINYELVNVIESPTCGDVTTIIENALLTFNRSNCLFSRGKFCDVIADPESRRDLSAMFSLPTPDREFMTRLLINFGDMTRLCKGEGAQKFLADLMEQVKKSPQKYRVPDRPAPTSG